MAKIYVGTYAKYNSGSIEGKWLDLEDYADKDEFEDACRELHEDEDDPEFMFQDWEGIQDAFISESYVDEDLWSYLDCDADEDAKAAYMACFDKWDEDDFNDRYRGEFRSWEDMAEQLLDETGELESIPEHLRYYFDYGAYARDLRLGGDFVEHDGHFFWGC